MLEYYSFIWCILRLGNSLQLLLTLYSWKMRCRAIGVKIYDISTRIQHKKSFIISYLIRVLFFLRWYYFYIFALDRYLLLFVWYHCYRTKRNNQCVNNYVQINSWCICTVAWFHLLTESWKCFENNCCPKSYYNRLKRCRRFSWKWHLAILCSWIMCLDIKKGEHTNDKTKEKIEGSYFHIHSLQQNKSSRVQ